MSHSNRFVGRVGITSHIQSSGDWNSSIGTAATLISGSGRTSREYSWESLTREIRRMVKHYKCFALPFKCEDEARYTRKIGALTL